MAGLRTSLLDRGANLLLAGSLLSWGVLRAATIARAGTSTPVEWALVALQLCVGMLFLLRSPALAEGSDRALLESVPSLLATALALRLAPPSSEWPALAQSLFVLGALCAMTSLLCLGRSFAIFPALREVVARGPYRIVRHPAYAGELGMLLATGFSRPKPIVWGMMLAALPLVIVRIRTEERVLAASDEYRRYAERVRWRLVPFVW